LEKHSKLKPRPTNPLPNIRNICLNNVVTQYVDQLYVLYKNRKLQPVTTTQSHLTNIAVLYIIESIAGVLSEGEFFRRFIDDIIW